MNIIKTNLSSMYNLLVKRRGKDAFRVSCRKSPDPWGQLPARMVLMGTGKTIYVELFQNLNSLTKKKERKFHPIKCIFYHVILQFSCISRYFSITYIEYVQNMKENYKNNQNLDSDYLFKMRMIYCPSLFNSLPNFFLTGFLTKL